MKPKYVSVKRAAELLPNSKTGEMGVSTARVRRLLLDGRLEGRKLDPDNPASPWLITKWSVDNYTLMPLGRPKRGEWRGWL